MTEKDDISRTRIFPLVLNSTSTFNPQIPTLLPSIIRHVTCRLLSKELPDGRWSHGEEEQEAQEKGDFGRVARPSHR